MPDATITSTASTFGTITGTFAADQSTVTGTITGIITGTLSGSVGVPGPQGAPGVGVPAGGTSGQFLQKTSGADYATDWVTVNLTGLATESWVTAGFYPLTGNPSGFLTASALSPYLTKADNLGSLTNFATARSNLGLGTMATATATDYLSKAGNLSGLANAETARDNLALGKGNTVYFNYVKAQNLSETQVTSINPAGIDVYDSSFGSFNIRPSNGLKYPDNTVQTTAFTTSLLTPYLLSSTAASTYQTQSAMSAYLTKADNLASVASPSTARTNLGLGSLDTPTFAGVNVPGSGTSVANLGATFLTINQQGSGQFTIQPSQGIVFPDATIQTTAYPGPVGATTWGSITGTLSSQTDLQTALDGKYSTSNPSGFITSSALAGYATESWVTAGFYPLSSNPAGYLTSAPVTSVAGRTGAITLSASDISGLGSLAVVNDAPSDGSQYARKNGAWDVVAAAADFISSVSSPLAVTTGNLTIDLSAYAQLSGATFTGNVFAPTPSPGTDSTRIATTEWVKDLDYAPLNSPQFNGNPRGPTPSLSDDDTSLATTEFVKGQGYITSSALSPYLTSADAASTYATILEPNVEGILTVEPSGANLAQVQVEQDANNYIRLFPGTDITFVSSNAINFRITPTALRFPDASEQTVAYPGPSGFLLKADNLSGLASTSTARTNLGLGTMATATASDYSTTTAANGLYYPLSSNPAGYLTSAPVTSVAGRTGAVTLAVADVSGAAPLASPTFSGTPSLPTGTIGVTQTAGNNTTALATTAFVTAAVPAFATTTNVIFDPSSTTLALNPSLIPQFLANSNYRNYSSLTQTSVNGSAAVTQFGSARELYTTSTTASGRATFMNAPYGATFMGLSSKSNSNIINWSKKIWVFGTAILGRSSYLGNANTVTRVNLGGRSANATGNLTQKGIGFFKVGGTGTFINLTVHNGTTLTNVASSVTLASDATVHYIIYSDGAGNVQLYLDGTLAASTTAGPTGSGTSGHNIYEEQLESATSSGSLSSMHIAGAGIYMSR